MTTKAEFMQAAIDAISEYPTAAQYYQAKDPRLLANLGAMATMLALASSEQDVAYMEPFSKSRDVTVLADAAVKGVMPFGKSTSVSIAVSNPAADPLIIASGRRLFDPQGRSYVVQAGVTVAAGGTATVSALQKSDTSFSHTVSASMSFYRIPIPEPDAGRYIVGVTLKNAANVEFAYKREFINVADGDKVFHLEIDEQRNLNVQFGASGIVGYQPSAGEVFTVGVTETEGYIELDVGAPFVFEYTTAAAERTAIMTMAAVLVPGANQLDVRTMREICSFPSVYDDSAVYRGNFDFLIRRQLSPLRFLSVWNEQIEEEARGANIDNINRLFVAALADGVDQTALNASVASIINEADDGYRITHVAVVHKQIGITIDGELSPVHDFAQVELQIRELLLAKYGPDSQFAKRGRNRVLYKNVNALLKDNIAAFQDAVSDLRVTITEPVGGMMPEHYRYVAAGSITVNLVQAEVG